MSEIITFRNFNEFYKSVNASLHDKFILNFYLISMMKRVANEEITVYDSYIITDTDESRVVSLWVDGCYLLFSSKWNDNVLALLSTKIDLSKYRRFLFNGSKPLILAFFKFNKVDFHVVKDRIIYECSELTESFNTSSGRLEPASMFDLDELAEMSYQYSQEEYKGKGRDYMHMRNIVVSGIEAENFFIWRDSSVICSICQVIYNGDHPPLIGHLYTAPLRRNCGYASSILYAVTKGLLIAGNRRCGLVSDAMVPASNKVFHKVGYKPIGTYVSVTKEMWDEKDII